MNNFKDWLTHVLASDFPDDMIAINFNLYEDVDDQWSVEFVGTSSFDPEDADWACDEVFATREAPYVFVRKAEWSEILDEVTTWLLDYFDNDSNATKMKLYKGIGVGFVDGDISILYSK